MAEDILVDVDVAYTAEVSQKGKRIRSEVVLSGKATVLIAEVAQAEAPMAIEVAWPDGAPLDAMHWRSYGNALWRPLVGPDGAAFVGGFGKAADAAMPPGRAPGRPVWSDYPFKASSQKPGHNRSLPFGLPSDAGTARVHSDTLEAARRHAQRTAAEDLLLVDGVLHMRSKPPVWAVGRTFGGPWENAGHVRLSLADHDAHADRLVSFPLDRREDAVAFGRLRADQVGELSLYRRRHLKAPALVVEDAEVWLSEGALPNPRLDDLRRAMGQVDFGPGIERLPEAAGDALATLAAVADADGDEWPPEASAAVAAFVSAADPMWTATWPNMGGTLERLRGLALREGFEGDAALRADADAFEGLAP